MSVCCTLTLYWCRPDHNYGLVELYFRHNFTKLCTLLFMPFSRKLAKRLKKKKTLWILLYLTLICIKMYKDQCWQSMLKLIIKKYIFPLQHSDKFATPFSFFFFTMTPNLTCAPKQWFSTFLPRQPPIKYTMDSFSDFWIYVFLYTRTVYHTPICFVICFDPTTLNKLDRKFP